MILRFLDRLGETLRVITDLVMDYDVDAKIEASRDDRDVAAWELFDHVGSVAYWERDQELVLLVERSERYSGKAWDNPPNKWKEPWSWSYKHPELPEWRCRAADLVAATLVFKEAWLAAGRKGRLWSVAGKFGDGKVYKREKGVRKNRKRGLPDGSSGHGT